MKELVFLKEKLEETIQEEKRKKEEKRVEKSFLSMQTSEQKSQKI